MQRISRAAIRAATAASSRPLWAASAPLGGSIARPLARLAALRASSPSLLKARAFASDAPPEDEASAAAASEAATQEPSQKRAVFVGNLAYTISRDMIREAFEPFGQVSRLNMPVDMHGRTKGYAFVQFENEEGARRAKEGMDGVLMAGRMMRTSWASSEQRDMGHDRLPPSKSLFIGNLSNDMTDKDLNDLFGSLEGVLDVRVAIDRQTGRPRGFAHADFTDIASAQAAIPRLRELAFHGRNVKANFATGQRAGD